MAGRKTFLAANLRIECNELCPIYYCGDPCRVRDHVARYAKIIRMGYECSMLLGGENDDG